MHNVSRSFQKENHQIDAIYFEFNIEEDLMDEYLKSWYFKD